ncbi:hypothetical protein [Actinomadura flavalba]|uniref:hypothetical protein n=1 Tax=Actinomadura flavalba TaxID=1120938 RepID=UPI00039B69AB|nr:hypothetical protein [Actinomadura flavalba]
MTAFNSYNTLMGTAQLETDLAQFILPPAVMIGFQFRTAKGNPLTLETASQKWGEAADKLGETAQEYRQSLAAVSAQDWTAEDRTAYAAKVEEFCTQLDIMRTFCEAVSVALLVFAWALFVFAVFAVGMGTFLAGLAVVAAAAAAGLITAGITATCMAIAGTCATITLVATGVLAGAAQLAAVVFQGGSMAAAVGQQMNGNDQALTDFRQAQATGSAAALANLGQNAVNAALSFRRTPGVMPPGSKTPVGAIDLDADRNANHTWNVGGGATFDAGGTEHTVGGHVKYGDHGFAGGDLSYQGKHTASGVTAGGNVEYTDEDGIGRGSDGSMKYGANAGLQTPGSHTPATPQGGAPQPSVSLPNGGVKFGVNGEHNFETGAGKVDGYESGQVMGGDVYKHTETVNYGGDKPPAYSSQTDTPTGTKKEDELPPPWDR